MKTLILIAFLLPTLLVAQQTYVPDDQFEKELIRLGLDAGQLDDYVLTSSIDTVKILYLRNKRISDLTGIEGFVSLDTLYCNENKLTSLDFSQNISLKKLYCHKNQLKTLDVSKNVMLQMLSCFDNQLKHLDISHNKYLEGLYCDNNMLTNIDLSKNTGLRLLSCYENQLKNLDLSNNSNLSAIDCSNNYLETLDLAQNRSIRWLICQYNNIRRLDLSHISSSEKLVCSYNRLVSLNLKNGNNANISFLDAESNPDLKCIQVDDPSLAENNVRWFKDDHTIYSEDCRYDETDVPEEQSISFSISPNPATDFINIETESLSEEIEIYNMLGIPVLTVIGSSQIDVSGLPRGIYYVKYSIRFEKMILH